MNTYYILITITRKNGKSEIAGEEKSISPILALKKFIAKNHGNIETESYAEINFTIKKA